ncbi:porin PorA family protein [Streptomyces badius]
MRRRAGLVLLAFAVFFAALSPLLRWCAFPRLAKVPPSQYQEVVQGIEFKWPFLTEKRDYEYVDAQTRTTAPIHYRGTRAFRGLEVYHFEQTIPWSEVAMPKRMPIEGITAEQIARTGMTRWYRQRRGIHREELRDAEKMGMSEDTGTAFSGHVKMREDYVADTVDLVKSQRVLVLLLTSYLPWGFLGLGTGLAAPALWLEVRSRWPRSATNA